ncbi:MAG: hypothetical protein R3C15_22245 [Thermoleophilia bacterium]
MVALDLPDRGEHRPVQLPAQGGSLVQGQVASRDVSDGDCRREGAPTAGVPADERAEDDDEQPDAASSAGSNDPTPTAKAHKRRYNS